MIAIVFISVGEIVITSGIVYKVHARRGFKKDRIHAEFRCNSMKNRVL